MDIDDDIWIYLLVVVVWRRAQNDMRHYFSQKLFRVQDISQEMSQGSEKSLVYTVRTSRWRSFCWEQFYGKNCCLEKGLNQDQKTKIDKQ